MEILLNPGPVNLSERVRKALLKPDLCHREAEFTALQNGIRKKLLQVYGLSEEEWAVVLLTGSGTSAMEAMLISLVPEDGKVLILENGVYGERLRRIADIHHIDHLSQHHQWLEVIDITELESNLSAGITHVAIVHHETTSGRLNDLASIAGVCQSKNIPLLVDAVSSFGAEEIRFSDWNMAACAATANKCLHGVPGTSFVMVRRDAMGYPHSRQRSLYLDLDTYLKQQDAGGTPFTQSVQDFYALDEALSEHSDAGGWRQRRSHYREKMKIIREGLQALGIKPLLRDTQVSSVLNAFHLPEGTDYKTLHDGLKQRGFVIYAGQGELARTIFRVSVMGAITVNDIERFLTAIKETL
ncbi:MAG: 2-aminoethylphosphonate aminotransferase [Gammaproteobacteria bacterium]